MTADMETSIRASRRRVARSRGALSGILLVILGLWAALVPFIGPYLNLAYTPKPNSAWHWTAARGWLEVLPGAAVFLGGLLLLLSSSRAMALFGGWLAALGGAWLVVGPALAPAIKLHLGQPDPSMGTNARAAIALLFFYAIGAAILFFASLALGRLSVIGVRDVRAAERRAEAAEAERQAALEAAAAQERADAENRRREHGHGDGENRDDREHQAGERGMAPAGDQPVAPQYAGGPQHQQQYGPDGQPVGNGQYAPNAPHGGTAAPQYPPAGQQYPPAGQQQYPPAPPPRD